MINVDFDFTSDTPNYWEAFTENNSNQNCPDPDAQSPTMQDYHRKLWSKQLPNGQTMELKAGRGSYYLYWDRFRFGADSIVNMYFHHRSSNLTDEIKKAVITKNKATDFQSFYKNYLHTSYTIGGNIIFPKNGVNSINNLRYQILKDRFDLFLECIRQCYQKQKNPFSPVFETNKDFFDLFKDFRGYVDFFLLQDIVSTDYQKIKFFNTQQDLENISYPKTQNEYLDLYTHQTEFVKNRNLRIKEECQQRNI